MRKRMRLGLAALLMAGLTVAIPASPVQANHGNEKGHWNQPPLVMSPNAAYGANIQDAAYYWQDNAFYRGYYPPLPDDSYTTGCYHLTGRICITEAYRWGSQLNGANGIADVRLYPDANKHIQSVVIYIASDLWQNPLLRQIAYRHEFGHALGLGHRLVGPGHGWVNTLMSEQANTPYSDNVDFDGVRLWQPPYHYH